MSNDILMPLRKLHGWLHEYPIYRDRRKKLLATYVPWLRGQLERNPRSVLLVMTPEHGNLGDHAIANAEMKLLEEAGIEYIEITDIQLNELNRTKLLSVMNGHPIIINGGGNMGTLWFDAECTHRAVIRNNPKSSIFIFPNTIFYENSKWGEKEFQKSIKIYNQHRNLYLYAREKQSYEVMKKAYRNVKLVPDIVLFLNKSTNNVKRHGCLLCLRKDLERTRTEEQELQIRTKVTELFDGAVQDVDMVVPGGVPAARREEVLQKKYDEFASAELVVTDRLHGMIFCAITGTPCIVIGSKSPKVRGYYEWIESLGYIRFANSTNDILKEYQLLASGITHYDNAHLDPYFRRLLEDLRECRGETYA